MKVVGPFKQLVTMDGLAPAGPLSDTDLEIIPNAGIVISDGFIHAVGVFEELVKDCEEVDKIDFPAVAFPGIIDSHTHLCFAGSRAKEYGMRLEGKTYQDIARNGGGIKSTVSQTRAASVEELMRTLHLRSLQLFSRGVTTCEVKSGYGLSVSDELKMLRAIAAVNDSLPIDLIATCLAAHVIPPEFSDEKTYLNHILEHLLPTVKKEGLANRADIFVEEGAFSVEGARDYLNQAKQMGFSITIHGDQFSRGGCRLAADVGAISVDHLECSTEEDAKLLLESGVIPTVLPGASLGLGIPFAPARMFLDSGLSLAIASDWNPGSAPMGNLLVQAALLGAYEKLTMAETWAGITVRAAKALGLDDRGILKQGLRADFVAFPADTYQEMLYRQGMLAPQKVFCRGEVIYG